MTLVYEDKMVRKGTHAFVIGVGDYPHAKPDKGGHARLRDVKDLPSAADSALLMADWLLENGSRLSPPLASLEVLVSDVPADGARYIPRDSRLRIIFDRADSQFIESGGKAWTKRMEEDPDCTALFYACGHGANDGETAVLFNSDLNLRRGGDAWAHLKVSRMAKAFRQQTHIATALVFLDACGEFVPYFSDNVRDCGFISPGFPSHDDRDKVWLLAAASAGHQAESGKAPPGTAQTNFDDEGWDDNPGLRFGRFTQTLLRGLGGASSRWKHNTWSVDNVGLWADLRDLHRVYFPDWDETQFEPSQIMTLNFHKPIISHALPRLPVIVSTDPAHRMIDFDLRIGRSVDGAGPWIDARPQRAGHAWAAHVPGERSVPLYALAMDADACHANFFKADQPLFDLRVVIP